MRYQEILFPRSRYYGQFTPEQLLFNANLQEFAHQVSITCSLQTGGKISSSEAFKRIETLWQQLQDSKQTLKIDKPIQPK